MPKMVSKHERLKPPDPLQQLRSLLEELRTSDSIDRSRAEVLQRLVSTRIAAFEALQRLQSTAIRPPEKP